MTHRTMSERSYHGATSRSFDLISGISLDINRITNEVHIIELDIIKSACRYPVKENA